MYDFGPIFFGDSFLLSQPVTDHIGMLHSRCVSQERVMFSDVRTPSFSVLTANLGANPVFEPATGDLARLSPPHMKLRRKDPWRPLPQGE